MSQKKTLRKKFNTTEEFQSFITDPFGIQILYLIIIAASKQRIFSSQFLIMTGEMRGRVCVFKKPVCQKSKENRVLLSVHTKSAVKVAYPIFHHCPI